MESVNDDRTFVFEWTVPLKATAGMYLKVQCLLHKLLTFGTLLNSWLMFIELTLIHLIIRVNTRDKCLNIHRASKSTRCEKLYNISLLNGQMLWLWFAGSTEVMSIPRIPRRESHSCRNPLASIQLHLWARS